jgi:AAA family ATP:ADP antiporter
MEGNLGLAQPDLAASSSPQFEPGRKTPLERLLSVITDVRAGEGLGAVLLTTDLAVLLGGYYLLKTVRESLILAEGGAEVKAYSSAAQAILLFGVVPVYGWIATRMNRNQLLRWTSIFFASNLLLFAYLEAGAFVKLCRISYGLEYSTYSPSRNSGP